MPIRADARSKGIHVKLDKETHAHFKARLAYHGLSMQEAFEEFARLVGSGSRVANNMMESLVTRHVRRELAEAGVEPLRRNRRQHMRDLDADTLYDLINEGADGEPQGG